MNTKEKERWNTYSGSHHLHTSLLPASSCKSTRKREYVLVNNPSCNNNHANEWKLTKERKGKTYIVSKRLMRRSQLQPVTTNAAAGGNRMATRMRTTSEALTMVNVYVNVDLNCCAGHITCTPFFSHVTYSMTIVANPFLSHRQGRTREEISSSTKQKSSHFTIPSTSL